MNVPRVTQSKGDSSRGFKGCNRGVRAVHVLGVAIGSRFLCGEMSPLFVCCFLGDSFCDDPEKISYLEYTTTLVRKIRSQYWNQSNLVLNQRAGSETTADRCRMRCVYIIDHFEGSNRRRCIP